MLVRPGRVGQIGRTRASGGTPTPTSFDVIGYGQSNFLGHINTQSSPPTAESDTFVWDPGTSGFVTPVGNGVRTFLNAMKAETGLPCRIAYGGQSGVDIAALQKGAGTGYYEALLARVAASGISPSYIIFHQGEGNANTAIAPVIATYQAAMDALHGDIVADIGKTRATCPMIISSLATVTDPSVTCPDSFWQTIKDAQATVNASYPHIHYSHSNMDAVLSDTIHYTAPSYGRSGARYARTLQALRGSVSTRPKWFATAAERVTTTTTRITVVHEMGSDFTPTSGITGFEATGDNGATWVSATGAREDATHILLTHANLGTTERKIRYQFGKNPTVSSAAADNGSLAVLLNSTPAVLVAAGAAVLPIPTYSTSVATGSGATQSVTGISVPGSTEALLVIVGHANAVPTHPYTGCTITAQPSNTPVTATLVEAHSSTGTSDDPCGAFYQAQVPSGTTSVDVSVTFSGGNTMQGRVHVWTVPVANLASTTKVGSGKANNSGSTTVTTTLATTSGGFILAFACNVSGSGGPASALSGTETYIKRAGSAVNAGVHLAGDTSNVATNAASSVTATFTNSADNTIVAASWR